MNPWLMLALGLVLGAPIGMFTLALLRAGRASDEFDAELSDTLLLDTVQRNHWQIGCIDKHFAVIGGSPPKLIGVQGEDVREVIARAKELHDATQD